MRVCRNWRGDAMWTHPLGPLVEPPGRRDLVRGVPKRARRRHVDAPAGAIDGAPLRGTRRVRGVPTRARGRIVDAPAGDIGQALWGARNVWAVCRNWRMDTMWTHPRGPLVELSEGHETCEDHAEVGAGAKCGRTRWGYMWSSLVGRETCERCAEMGAGAPCGQGRWGHGWSSLAGHEPCARYAEMGSGAPCGRTRWGHGWSSLGGTKRMMGVPKWARERHVDARAGAIGGAP